VNRNPRRLIDMTEENDLDPVARLRAADPAGEVVPRAGFVDDVVARVADSAADPSAESTPMADVITLRTRRRPRWLPIAAVAASIAIVGAAGYGLGTTMSGTSNLADGAAPPISLPSSGSQEGAAQDGREPAVGQGVPADQTMSNSIYPYGYGRNHFTASGLDNSEGTAQAYAFDPRAASNSDRIAALATALDISSPVEMRGGGWAAGPQDGSAPALSVSFDGTLSFYYQDPRVKLWLCEKDADGGEGTETCAPTGEAPSEDAAIGALRALLVAAGRDPATFSFTSHVWDDSPTRIAEARPVIDGQSIDTAWSLEMGEGGIAGANGALADVVELGAYPVVSEQEGFERLSDPRFGGAPTILPIAVEQQTPMPEEWVPPTEPPATPTPGTSLSWPVNEVTIVSARLGLASQWQPDGSVLVVPSYEFTDADGGTWSVIAVADSMLDFESE
jgi:hypothetical protein